MSRNDATITRDLMQGLFLAVTAFAWCCCLWCLGRGRDLPAAYWGLTAFLLPRLTGWVRETEWQ